MYEKRVAVLKKHLKDKTEITGTLFLECNFGTINIELVILKNCKIATHLLVFNKKTAKICKISKNCLQINNDIMDELIELHFAVFSIDEPSRKIELLGMDCSVDMLNWHYDKLKIEMKKIFDNALKDKMTVSSVQSFNSFFDKINDKFYKIFDRGKDEVILNEMFRDSRWKRIISNGEFFVLGCLFKNEKIYAIGIGKPVACKNRCAKTLMQITKFYPARKNYIDGFGYYLGFKDAITGKNINLTL